MSDFNYEETIKKFKGKCVVTQEDEKGWSDTIKYIDEHGLAHEVFMSAIHSYSDDMTKQQAIDAICIAMLDWDI